MPQALTDIRVIDASRILAGPYCGQVLGDLGAEIIKIERPGTGDDTRTWGPPFYDQQRSAYFLAANRNKRSLALDLSQGPGQEILHRLLAQSDVLIENFRTDSAKKMGLGAAELLQRHPRLIVCSITGYGHTGPWSEEPGYDLAIQAQSGFMAITGPADGSPYKVGVAVADLLTGLYASTSILACLHARQHSGHGYAIDLGLLDCAIASQANLAQAYLSSGNVPKRQGNEHLQIVPYSVYRVADGWLTLNVGNDRQWQDFCKCAQVPELGTDPRFLTNPQRVQHRTELTAILERLMATKTIDEWSQALESVKVPHAPIQHYDRVFAHEQVAARDMKITIHDPQGHPVDLIGSPIKIPGLAEQAPSLPPALGEHSDNILQQILSATPTEIANWRTSGIIA